MTVKEKTKKTIIFKQGIPLEEEISWDDILIIDGRRELVRGVSYGIVETLTRENKDILNPFYDKQKLYNGNIEFVSRRNYKQDRNFDRMLKEAGL